MVREWALAVAIIALPGSVLAQVQSGVQTGVQTGVQRPAQGGVQSGVYGGVIGGAQGGGQGQAGGGQGGAQGGGAQGLQRGERGHRPHRRQADHPQEQGGPAQEPAVAASESDGGIAIRPAGARRRARAAPAVRCLSRSAAGTCTPSARFPSIARRRRRISRPRTSRRCASSCRPGEARKYNPLFLRRAP